MSENQGKGRVTLKEYFEADKMPREGHFADLIDASLNKIDDQLFIRVEGEAENSARFVGIGSTDPQSPLSIRNRTGDAKRIGLEDTGGDEEWHISVNDPGGNNGFLIASNDNPDAIFMLDADGKVGIGTQSPEERLHVNGSLRLEQGVAVHEISNNPTLNENSPEIIPTQQAVKEYIDDLLVGSISAFAMQTPPAGWLECNGQPVSREAYSRLFNKIGTVFGADGTTTFNLPDLRGEFIRGWDHGRNKDSDRSFGSGQADSIQNHQHNDLGHSHTFSHSHGASISNAGDHSHTYWAAMTSANGHNTVHASTDHSPGEVNIRHQQTGGTSTSGNHSHGISINETEITTDGNANISGAINANVENETRPTNIALLYCIKY